MLPATSNPCSGLSCGKPRRKKIKSELKQRFSHKSASHSRYVLRTAHTQAKWSTSNYFTSSYTYLQRVLIRNSLMTSQRLHYRRTGKPVSDCWSDRRQHTRNRTDSTANMETSCNLNTKLLRWRSFCSNFNLTIFPIGLGLVAPTLDDVTSKDNELKVDFPNAAPTAFYFQIFHYTRCITPMGTTQLNTYCVQLT